MQEHEGDGYEEVQPIVAALAPGRPVLDVSEDRFAGYLLLERDERRFTALAIERHAELVDVWYRFFTLLRNGTVDQQFDLGPPETSVSRQLAMHFIAASAGSAKLILDAGLAGYYSQAFALVRHLFETWLRLEYVRLRPDQAALWFEGSNGRPPRPPNEGTIHRYLRKHSTNGREATVETIIDDKLEFLNLMAHPSPATLQQTVGLSENRLEVGANYIPRQCVSVLHEGASGLRFLLTSLNEFFEQPADWYEELQEAISRHSMVLDRELQRLDENEGELATRTQFGRID